MTCLRSCSRTETQSFPFLSTALVTAHHWALPRAALQSKCHIPSFPLGLSLALWGASPYQPCAHELWAPVSLCAKWACTRFCLPYGVMRIYLPRNKGRRIEFTVSHLLLLVFIKTHSQSRPTVFRAVLTALHSSSLRQFLSQPCWKMRRQSSEVE